MFESLRTQRLARVVSWTGAVLLLAVFLKNAWACDDAYITFRSIEQLFAGNGPRWNPHERVQVFTSPLWFGVLAAFRISSSDVFLNAIIASLASFVATLLVLRRIVRDDMIWLCVMALLVASNGFFDYTSSGLENPLCYLVLGLFLLYFFRVFEDGAHEHARLSHMRRLLFFAGLLLLCRHDLVTLILAPTLYALDHNRALAPKRKWIQYALIALLPFFLWSAFALVYYGTILPNPAYAKLWTGIPAVKLWQKGWYYLTTVALRDSMTIFVVVVGAALLLLSRKNMFRALGAGVILNLFYIVSVGGDFMLGRFLSHAFLLVAVSLAVWIRREVPAIRHRTVAVTLGLLMVYWFAYPHTPVNSPIGHAVDPPDAHGFADERGIYRRASLARYLQRDNGVIFPDTKWAHDGVVLRESGACCSFNWSMGFYGYWAGTEIRIVDLFAICDPLLARMRVTRDDWRIGHFSRQLPEGYLASVNHRENLIVDPLLHARYETVRLVTQSDKLFSLERMRAIIAFNLPQ